MPFVQNSLFAWSECGRFELHGGEIVPSSPIFQSCRIHPAIPHFARRHTWSGSGLGCCEVSACNFLSRCRQGRQRQLLGWWNWSTTNSLVQVLSVYSFFCLHNCPIPYHFVLCSSQFISFLAPVIGADPVTLLGWLPAMPLKMCRCACQYMGPTCQYMQCILNQPIASIAFLNLDWLVLFMYLGLKNQAHADAGKVRAHHMRWPAVFWCHWCWFSHKMDIYCVYSIYKACLIISCSHRLCIEI